MKRNDIQTAMPIQDKRNRCLADIALVINNLKAGGSERVLTTLANAWAGMGRKVCVITLSGVKTDFFSLDPAVKRIVIGMPLRSKTRISALFYSVKRIFSIRRAIMEAGAPVVITFLPVLNIMTVIATFGLGVRVVISERNDPAQQIPDWPWNSLRRLLYCRADAVTANSRGAIDTLKNYTPENKLFFVPNPVSVPTSNDTKKKGVPTILIVGSLTYQKAHDILLDAFAKIAPHFPEWRLSIVGDGQLKDRLKAQADSLGISDGVEWRGRIADTSGCYRAADIFVLPSRFEGTPNALQEAMTCGLPVIVSDASPGPLEYVEHDVSGLVVPVDDVSALAAALERLINDNALRRRLGDIAGTRLAECELPKVLEVWDHVIGW